MARDVSDTEIVETRADLARWFEVGCKPAGEYRVGAEHEKVPFFKHGLAPVPYEGANGVDSLLRGMQAKLGWSSIEDGGHLIGLFDEVGKGAISLEPGGQFELSGAPCATIHEVRDELDAHLTACHAVAAPLGVGFLTLGMSPKWTRAETPVMPKSRYAIMARYMPKVGGHGLDMMFRTTTVQANLDFSSEADMVAKLRLGVAAQPIITALFANSPFTDGVPNGYLSKRSAIWLDTDAARTGMMPFAFEPGFGFEAYVDYALDVPMYFVKRGDVYHDVAGASFRDLLAGRLAQLPGERATVSDWANHLSTIFPEVRLKRYLEMRGADLGPPDRILALQAFVVGLYYDTVALDEALAVVKDWSDADRLALRRDVPKMALKAEVAGRSARDVARDLLAISARGLKRRARLDRHGRDETHYLDCLNVIAESGRTAAEDWLAAYHGRWGGDIDRVFEEATF